MKDFSRKACLVTGDHRTHTSDVVTYSSVVMRDIVHIALTMAALHDLVVKAADILSAYMMAFNREKIWTVLGPEFGDNTCKSVIIIRALYGLCLLKGTLCMIFAEIGV